MKKSITILVIVFFILSSSTILASTSIEETNPNNLSIKTNNTNQLTITDDGIINAKNNTITSIGKPKGDESVVSKAYVDENGGVWNQTGNNISYTQGNVGIGVDNPNARLHLNKSFRIENSKGKASFYAISNKSKNAIVNLQGSSADIHYNSLRGSSHGLLRLSNDSNGGTLQFQDRTNNIQRRFHIAGNGNIGIGTTNPVRKLEVNGTIRIGKQPDGKIGTFNVTKTLTQNFAGSDWLRIYGEGENDNGRMIIETGDNKNEPILFRQFQGNIQTGSYEDIMIIGKGNNNNVGIGTTNPNVAFHVKSDQNNQARFVLNGTGTGPGSGGPRMFFDRYVQRSGLSGLVNFRKSNGSKKNPEKVGNNWLLGQIASQGYDNNSFETASAISLKTDVNGEVSDGSMPGMIKFQTTPNNSVNKRDRMVINSEGNVGIGTINPDDKLEVNAGNIEIIDDNNPNTYGLEFGNVPYISGMSGASDGIYGDPNLHLTSNDSITLYPMSGNVGVGTGSPSYALDVNGEVHASDFTTSSDARLKENVNNISNALDKVKNMRGVKFEWNERANSMREGYTLNEEEIGVIAQEVENVSPSLVEKWKGDDGTEDYRAVKYGRITGLLIESVKDLEKENNKQEKEINTLKSELCKKDNSYSWCS